MSHARPGKRPRDAGIEGSTIVIPHKQNNANYNDGVHQGGNDASSSTLILMLAKSCKKHNEQHEKQGHVEDSACHAEENQKIPPGCLKSLTSLGRIIPKVEKAYRATSDPKTADIYHLCDFYLSVVQRSFCPSALKLFEFGQNPANIVSRVILLLEHALSENNRSQFKSQWRRPLDASSIPLWERLCHAAASLLGILSDEKRHFCLFQDFIHTIYDLSLLIDANYFAGDDAAEPIEVILFAETLGTNGDEPKEDLVLLLDSLDSTKLLQAALLNTFLQWAKLVRDKRLATFPDPLDNDSMPDTEFSAILCKDGRMDMTNETMAELTSTLTNILRIPFENKNDYRDGLRRHAAFRIVQELWQDFQRAGASDLHSVLDISTLVSQAALEALKVGHESKVIDVMAECIQTCLSNPPRVDGWSLTETRLATWRVACPALVECVPLLPDVGTVSAQNLGSAILFALGKAFDRPEAAGFLSLLDYPRAVEADFLEAMFLLVEVSAFSLHAVWMCVLAIDCAQESFGSLNLGLVVQDIFEKEEEIRSAGKYELSSGQGRKRTRPSRACQLNEGQPKRPRTQASSSDDIVEYQASVLHSCIVHIFATALADRGNDRVEEEDDDDGVSKTSQTVVSSSTLTISSVANIVALSRSLCSGDNFGSIMETFVSHLNGALLRMMSKCEPRRQSSDNTEIRGFVKLFERIRTQSDPPCNLPIRCLVDFANNVYLLMDNETVLQSVADFPVVNEWRQRCRIDLLRSCLKKESGRIDASSDLIETTLENLRDASLKHTDPLVRLLYWQIASWLLVVSTDIERHLTIAGDSSDFVASKLVKFLVSTPFSDGDETVRAYAAGKLGKILVSNPLVRAFLAGAVTIGRGSGAKQDKVLDLADGLEETRLFKDVDNLLYQYCRIPQSQLSFTVGLSIGSNSDDGKARMCECIGFHRSGIRSLMSLFESFFLAEDPRLEVIARNAFLRVVRLWVFFGQHQVSESSSFTFSELTRVLSRTGFSRCSPFLMHVAPATFRDVLFPSSVYFTSIEQGNLNPNFDRLENQCRMLYVLIEKFLSIGDSADFCVLGGATPSDVEQSLDAFLPNALAQVVMEKDYDTLRSLTAFRRYAINRRRETKKGRRSTVTPSEADIILVSFASKSKLWARNLEVQTMELCSARDISERLLPLLLMHAGPDEDRFFTKRVLMNKLTLPKMLQTHGEHVLKGLVKEFGESDEIPRLAMWALKKAAVARDLSQEETSLSGSTAKMNDSNDRSVSSWVSGNFMHLLVNLVQSRWREKSPRDRIRALRCLRAMLNFLEKTGSSQFVPQIMSTVNASIGDSEDHERTDENTEIRYLAVQILDLLVRLVWEDSWEVVGENLTSVVVALIPVLSETLPARETLHSKSSCAGRSTETAVSLLHWLTQGDRGSRLAPFFKNIPFLPSTSVLDPVKASLAEIGVDFDDLRLTMTEGSMSRFSSQSDITSASADSRSVERLGRVKAHMQTRIKTVCSLLTNENSSIRLNALKHLNSLLQSNRAIFQMLVDAEETSSMTKFLTVCASKSISNQRGVVSSLVETLLSRSALETNEKVRILVAKVFGEVGAIAERRLLSHGINNNVSSETDLTYDWRLDRPPWKSTPVEYQVSLLTDHLVSALKASPTSLDHQKIAFTIQEVLALACSAVVDNADDLANPSTNDTTTTTTTSGMPKWLSCKLEKAGALQIVEPFMDSEYCERETSNPSPPPFFSCARSYCEWLSGWLRYMVHRSKTRNESEWCGLLNACRLAFRTQSGISIGEFLLPVIVLDRICFGNLRDEECVLQEIVGVFKGKTAARDGISMAMAHSERQKAVATLFSMIDTLRYWSEKDTEDRHRIPGSNITGIGKDSGGWTGDESIMRIEDVLKAIPLSLQAKAAAETGMYARSLCLLEMASRRGVVEQVFNDAAAHREYIIPTRSISSGSCPDDSVDLLKDTLATLGEYETIAVLSEENLSAGALSKALDSIRLKESSKDWSGALQDYERAQHLASKPKDGESLMQGTLNCLLELDQFESVLRQVKGSSPSPGEKPTNSLVPYAVEASWRLGRWDVLAELLEDEAGCNTLLPSSNAQVEVGRAMLAIHQKDAPSAMDAIDGAREAVMRPLSTAARESYARAYASIVMLHSLREMEDSVPIICSNATESDLGTFVNGGGGFWRARLETVDPSYTITLCQSRLALARLDGSSGLEASLFLAIGKRARKNQQYGIAASALAQAESSFALVNDDQSLDTERSELILQLAKLKHEMGQSSASLRLLHMDDIESMLDLEQEQLESETLRRACALLRKRNNGMSKDNAIEIFRKGALMSTKWMIEGGMKDCAEVVQRFRTIHKVAPKWEKGHFQYAKYVESMLNARIEALQRRARGQMAMDEDGFRQTCLAQDRLCQKYVYLSVKHFVEALTLDLKHLFQALPRLLSLWFEFSAVNVETNHGEPMSQDTLKKIKEILNGKQSDLNETVAGKYRAIPAHAFYSALPQLISRVADPNGDLSLVIRTILSRVLSRFPGQAMWPLAWLLRSKASNRRAAGERVFKEAESQILKVNPADAHGKLLVACKSLFDFLHELSKLTVKEGKRTLTIRSWTGEVSLSAFTPPIQAALSPTLTPLESGQSQDPFPRQIPRMKEFSRNVGVMVSKARPKKLKAKAVIIQSNPRVKHSREVEAGEFHFLVKQEAKGDLRKDARVQDFNNVINRLLMSPKRKGATLHRRNLRLRTFTVTCLSEETGILEWVPQTNSLRSVVSDSYNPQASPFSAKRRGRRMANSVDAMMRANFERKCQDMFFNSGDLKKAARLFQDLMLKPNPPVLFWWFCQHFMDPHRWYEARMQFTLSAAVWSAVGHVIGLGDRHSENILVDESCGEMVHVDFDCIFDKGLNLPKPEIVPFRLTSNMIDAFGPVGADGIYSSSLKDAMSTLRSNRDTLLSVLEPFIKDPVIDWKRSRTQQRSATQQQDRQTREAKRSITVVADRLQGIYNVKNPNFKRLRRTDLRTNAEMDGGMSQLLALSVEGQVHKMISEATSSENLVQLYVGWMPWI